MLEDLVLDMKWTPYLYREIALLPGGKAGSRKHTLLLLLLLPLLFMSCENDDTLDTEELEPMVVMPPEESTDTNLDLVFSQVFGGSQDDTFQDIITTTDGGYVALGYSQSVDGDITDNSEQVNKYWLVKTDSEGTIQWSKTYGGSDDDRGEHLIQTNDGGYLLAGSSTSSDGDVSQNAGFYDHWLVKLDASGTIQWERSYGFSGSDQLFSVIQTQDGGYFTGGFLDVSASGGAGNDGFTDTNTSQDPNSRAVQHGVGEFWGHKLDANGNLIWRRYFGGTNNDRVYQVIEAQDGGILMVGASESNDFDVSNSRGSYDFWAVRLDDAGNLLWEQSYGGSEIDIAYAATATPDGGYLLAGDTRSADQDITNLIGSADVWLVKIDDQGNVQWQKTVGGTNFESARSIIPHNGGYAFTGASRSADGDVTQNNGQNDIWVATIDDTGNLSAQINLGGNNQDFGYGITSSGDALIITGDTQSTNGAITASKGGVDALIIKLQ